MQIPFPFGGGRAPVLAANCVSSSQPLATQAGIRALQEGGNAVDAALATAITLTVVEPTMNGIGGDSFAILWDGQKIHGMNSSGRAPAAWTPEKFAQLNKMPAMGWDTVTVPGVVAGWVLLSETFGRLPFKQLFQQAIHYAKNGFAVSPVIARQWSDAVNTFHQQPGFMQAFAPSGHAPKEGDIWQFPAQADTLEVISQTKGSAFYKGELTDRMVAFAKQTGGCFTHEDFASHTADWVEPLSFNYGEYSLLEIPPNGSGIAAQIALGILDILEARKYPADSVQRIHLQIEAMRLAFADVYAYLSDPLSMQVSPSQLLARPYLKKQAARIQNHQAGNYGPGDPHSGGTVYLCASDASGMMISYIQSNFKGFGSGVVAPGGIAFHNRGMGFSLEAGHPNQVGPGKRPFHTILPAFLMKNHLPEMAFGVMGGNMQPQGHIQFIMRYIDDAMHPQACSNAPRWRINDEGQLTVEANMPQSIIDGLQALGHVLEVMPADSLEFGSAQAIAKRESTCTMYIAGSDHRRDGQSAGF